MLTEKANGDKKRGREEGDDAEGADVDAPAAGGQKTPSSLQIQYVVAEADQKMAYLVRALAFRVINWVIRGVEWCEWFGMV